MDRALVERIERRGGGYFRFGSGWVSAYADAARELGRRGWRVRWNGPCDVLFDPPMPERRPEPTDVFSPVPLGYGSGQFDTAFFVANATPVGNYDSGRCFS